MASNKLEVTLAALNKGQDYAILTGKSPIYSYDNGKRTSDSPIGFKVSVALQGNRLSPLSVKIELLVVRFIDCIINIYTINGQMLMSATATGVEIVK